MPACAVCGGLTTPSGVVRPTRRGRPLVARLDHAVAYGKSDDLGAILNVQFVQDVAEVIFDCVLGDHQSLGELAVAGDALHEQVEHFAFPLREYGQAFEHVWGRSGCGVTSELTQKLARQRGRQGWL